MPDAAQVMSAHLPSSVFMPFISGPPPLTPRRRRPFQKSSSSSSRLAPLCARYPDGATDETRRLDGQRHIPQHVRSGAVRAWKQGSSPLPGTTNDARGGHQGQIPPESGTVFAKAPGHRGILRLASARDKVVPVQAMSPLIALTFEQGWSAGEIFPFVEFEGQRPAAANRVRELLGGAAGLLAGAAQDRRRLRGRVRLPQIAGHARPRRPRHDGAWHARGGVAVRARLLAAGRRIAASRDGDARRRNRHRRTRSLSARRTAAVLAPRSSSDQADRSCIAYRRADLAAPLRFPDAAAASMRRAAAERELAAIGLSGAQSLVQHRTLRKSTGRRRTPASI